MLTMEIKPYNPRDWRSHPPYRFDGYASSMKRAPLKRLVKVNQTDKPEAFNKAVLAFLLEGS